MFSLAPLMFPPDRIISDMRFGFRYVESPFPGERETAVVEIGDEIDCTKVCGIETVGTAINLLAAKIAACTFVTLVLVPIASSLLDSILLLSNDGDDIDIVEGTDVGIECVLIPLTPKVNEVKSLGVRDDVIFMLPRS